MDIQNFRRHQTITLTNEGNADAVLSDAVSSTGAAQGQYFDITWQAQTVKSGDKATIYNSAKDQPYSECDSLYRNIYDYR